MQYPIIDNLIYAYHRNGWTGNSLQFVIGGITDSTGLDSTNPARNRTDFIKKEDVNTILLSLGNNIRIRRIYFYDINFNFLTSMGLLYNFPNVVDVYNSLVDEMPENAEYVRFVVRKLDDTNIMPNEYVININGSFEDNFSHRLKLPLLHYFPHPVIDAIISAADGQHTEEEKEILRHYLAPLGIGGI